MKNLKVPIQDVDINHIESNSQAGQDLFVIAVTQGKKNGVFLEIGACHLKYGNNTYLLEKNFNWRGFSIDCQDVHTKDYYEKHLKQFWPHFYSDVKDSNWPPCPESLDKLPLHIQEEIRSVHRYDDYMPRFYTWAHRQSTEFMKNDALTLDYSFLPEKVDYLQIDIDPPFANLQVLEILLQTGTKFSVITFEHDLWQNTEEVRYVRSQSRILLKHYGYELIVNDVTIEPGKGIGIDDNPIYFEDWYVYPELIDIKVANKYRLLNENLYPKYYTEILFAK